MKENNIEKIDKDIKKISRTLNAKTSITNFAECCKKIAMYAEELLKQKLGDNGCKLPVNIEQLAIQLGFKVSHCAKPLIDVDTAVLMSSLVRFPIAYMSAGTDTLTEELAKKINISSSVPPLLIDMLFHI